MSTCGCGRSIASGSQVCERCAALLVLGLAQGATDAEIKDAYRTLAKVWHPDRFQNDQNLRLKAEEKLKEINSAYQLLTTATAESFYSNRARSGSQTRESRGRTPRQEGTEEQEAEPHAAAGSSNHDRRSRQAPPPGPGRTHAGRPATRRATPPFRVKRRVSITGIAIAVGILIMLGIWIAPRYGSAPALQSTTSVESGAVPSENSPQSHSTTTNDPAKSAAQAQARSRTAALPAPRSSVVVYPSEDPQAPYFTVGSTKVDVIRVQGRPNQSTENVFRYGLSEIYFRYGRVLSWRIDSSSPLRARLFPSVPVESRGYFTVGSSEDEVLAAQGTPDRFSDDTFGYGLSEVYFKNGRVQSWHMDSSSPLKARTP